MITATHLRVSLNGNSLSRLLLSVSADVTSFSELFFIKEPHDVTVLRRDAVVLDCQAHGEAPIGIRWLKNAAALTESERVYLLTNGSLFISEVESRKDKSDEGFYQCLAQNKYGSILSQRAHHPRLG
uniref:Protogenin A-like n=1 Tax=Sinocyclocheilus rhinocerous TaxID=307959 RepID=A0A673JKV5_9TELE